MEAAVKEPLGGLKGTDCSALLHTGKQNVRTIFMNFCTQLAVGNRRRVVNYWTPGGEWTPEGKWLCVALDHGMYGCLHSLDKDSFYQRVVRQTSRQHRQKAPPTKKIKKIKKSPDDLAVTILRGLSDHYSGSGVNRHTATEPWNIELKWSLGRCADKGIHEWNKE